MLVTPDGTRRSYAGSNSTLSYGGVYHHWFDGYSTDGSFVDYGCTYQSSGGGTTLSGEAQLADGTRITYGSPTSTFDQVFPTKITDRHGNIINIAYVGNHGPEIDTITDTLGRTITFKYESGRLIAIKGPGYNGTTRTFVRLHYAQKTLSYAFATGYTTSVAQGSPYLIDAIYYPTTNTGYWFGDTNPTTGSYSSYGMIAKVMSQRGMSITGESDTSQGTVSQGTMSRQEVYNFPMASDSSLTDAPVYTNHTETWDGMDTSAVTTCSGATTNAAVTCYSVSSVSGAERKRCRENKAASHEEAKESMKSQVFLALVIAAIQLIPSGCSNGDLAYIPPVTGAVFTSSNEAWVLTRKGLLKRISINGQSINVVDAQQRVQGMSFISPSQGWTVDSDWNVWHFNGDRWASVGHNSDNRFGLAGEPGLIFADDRVGWARTLGRLFATEDGGRTWKKVLDTELSDLLGVSVLNRDIVFLYGRKGMVAQTRDRGQTWTNVDLGVTSDVTALACREEGRECWAGTAGGEIFAIYGDASTKRVPFSTSKEMTITDIYPFSDGGLLVSGFTLVRDGNPTPGGVLFTTGDEGATWQMVDVPQDDRFEQVACFGDAIWLASHSAIYRSSDGGGSWAKVYGALK